jgi:hypothetical protein
LNRRDALLLTLALWLINQIIGFTVLHYPWDAITLAWGAILGAVAPCCTLIASAPRTRLVRQSRFRAFTTPESRWASWRAP